MSSRGYRSRVDVRALLADEHLRQSMIVGVIVATQAREGIDTSVEQATKAYLAVRRGR